jgi:homoserine kinase
MVVPYQLSLVFSRPKLYKGGIGCLLSVETAVARELLKASIATDTLTTVLKGLADLVQAACTTNKHLWAGPCDMTIQ